jgi:site-specific DNA-cytosine methylase
VGGLPLKGQAFLSQIIMRVRSTSTRSKLRGTIFPDTIHMGDVTKVGVRDGQLVVPPLCEWSDSPDYHKIDLLLGGSPCQGFSFAGRSISTSMMSSV